MRELLQLNISFDTTLEDVQLLRREITNFVLEKENSRDFQPEVNVEITSLASVSHVSISQCQLLRKTSFARYSRFYLNMLTEATRWIKWN